MGSSPASRLCVILVFILFCLALIPPTRARLADPPVLLAKTNSTRSIAVESTTLTAEPFTTTAPVQFVQDNRTRVMLFANNLTLLPGETAASITATAEDGNHIQYPFAHLRNTA